RPPGHDPPLPRLRSRTAHLSLPRAGFSAYRRSWRSGDGNSELRVLRGYDIFQTAFKGRSLHQADQLADAQLPPLPDFVRAVGSGCLFRSVVVYTAGGAFYPKGLASDAGGLSASSQSEWS